MTTGAALKLERATERIAELDFLLREKRPFSYVLRTDTQTGDRFTLPKKNQAVADEAAAIAGDAVHNIRTALDHVYWDIVSPFATTPTEKKRIQFPFCERATHLHETVKSRLANKVSKRFFDAVMALKPFGEARGNRLLYLIHLLDIPDKHRFLIPAGDYTRLSSDIMRRQVPDFPHGIIDFKFSRNRRSDVHWRSANLGVLDLGVIVPPTTNIFEKELDVPVDIVFAIPELDFLAPMISTLNKFIEVAVTTISKLYLAAS